MQQLASSTAVTMSRRHLSFVPLTWGLCLVSCKSLAEPCFDGSYDVELLKRVEEYSTCPAPWASDWIFRVVPKKVSLRGAYGECSQVALRLEASPPRNFTGLGLSYFTNTGAGAVEGRYASNDTTACPAWSTLEAHLPSESWDVAEAAPDDAVLWKMDIIDIDETCGIPVPDLRDPLRKSENWIAGRDFVGVPVC